MDSNTGRSYKGKEIKKGISGSTLKIIAIISMLIDHIGAIVIGENSSLQFLYYSMRIVGRIAFPIFCFLIVEGFKYTRSRKKYGIRLAIFALVSEIPFNLAIQGKILYMGYQNVFFTLLIGLLVMQGFAIIEEKKEDRKFIPMMLVLFLGVILAELLRTDYGGGGVVAIAVMYAFRHSARKSMLGGCLILTVMAPVQVVGLVNLLLIKFYNGKRGLSLKYIFYLFYPSHLILLYMIRNFFTL